jgi:nanoRNase/pAp phosphatase (c-di-AMP/oligoRNAs hydrolase)
MSDPTVKRFNPVTQEQLQQLRDAVGAGPLLILTHDNPDPDALAAGSTLAALCALKWDTEVHLGYSGLVARAENKAMMQILTPEWESLDLLGDPHDYPVCALVDSQPGSGNNSLPHDIIPRIVFDHHVPVQESIEGISFADIRTDIGATTSLVYQYFEAAGLEPDSKLATAIFYGIQTDTQGLSRGGTPEDQEIYFKLLGIINREKLVQVIQARVPREYFKEFSRGLEAAMVYERTIVSYLGSLHRPDFVAELADALIRLEGTHAVLTMGYHENVLYFSLRTRTSETDAGHLIQAIVSPYGRAGGHGTVAGGQIQFRNRTPDEVAEEVRSKFLKLMNESRQGMRLID